MATQLNDMTGAQNVTEPQVDKTFDTYYTRSSGPRPAFPTLDRRDETDVCVIGGGLAGLATALGLIERGKSVIVLEGRQIGYGASGRNGGFVLPGFAAPFKHIVRKIGHEKALELYGLSRKAQALIRDRIKKFQIDCDPVDGGVEASWFGPSDGLKSKAAFSQTILNNRAEYIPYSELKKICKTDRYHDGIYYPENFHMHVLKYQYGLSRVISDQGGRIYENSPAIVLSKDGRDHIVNTPNGSVRAKDIVFCGSAYFNGIEPKLARACLPVSTYVMVTKPIDQDLLNAAIARPYAIRDTRFADDYYRVLPDNRILWGGRVGYGPAIPANLADTMRGDLVRIYPQLESVEVDHVWSGIMGYTTHQMPHIGKLREGVWACTHFGGNGVGPTTAGGEIIASAIAEGDTRYQLFKPFGYGWTGGVLGPMIAKTVYQSWRLGDMARQFHYNLRHGNARKTRQRA